MHMSTLAIAMPDEDLAFLRAWTAEQGTSAEAFLAQQARNLRQNLQRGLHPSVRQATGVISLQADGGKEHLEHQERKHG